MGSQRVQHNGVTDASGMLDKYYCLYSYFNIDENTIILSSSMLLIRCLKNQTEKTMTNCC